MNDVSRGYVLYKLRQADQMRESRLSQFAFSGRHYVESQGTDESGTAVCECICGIRVATSVNDPNFLKAFFSTGSHLHPKQLLPVGIIRISADKMVDSLWCETCGEICSTPLNNLGDIDVKLARISGSRHLASHA